MKLMTCLYHWGLILAIQLSIIQRVNPYYANLDFKILQVYVISPRFKYI